MGSFDVSTATLSAAGLGGCPYALTADTIHPAMTPKTAFCQTI